MPDPQPTGFDLQTVLRGLGINAESFDRLRLGRGIVGRVTYAIIAVLAVLAIAARQTTDKEILIVVIAIAAILFLIYLIGVLRFAAKNPAAALLDGAEFLMYRRLDLAAKDLLEPPEAPSMPPEISVQSPPLIAPPTEDEPES